MPQSNYTFVGVDVSSMIQNLAGMGTVEVNWLARELPDPNDQREYAQERCIVAVTEALAEAISNAGISNTELARRLGVTPARVSHILSERNLTLKSVADVLWACGLEFEDLKAAKLGVVRVPFEHAMEWHGMGAYRFNAIAPSTHHLYFDFSGLATQNLVPLDVTPEQIEPTKAAATANNNLALAA